MSFSRHHCWFDAFPNVLSNVIGLDAFGVLEISSLEHIVTNESLYNHDESFVLTNHSPPHFDYHSHFHFHAGKDLPKIIASTSRSSAWLHSAHVSNIYRLTVCYKAFMILNSYWSPRYHQFTKISCYVHWIFSATSQRQNVQDASFSYQTVLFPKISLRYKAACYSEPRF